MFPAYVLANEIWFGMQVLMAVLAYVVRECWWMERVMLIAQHLP
jgi:hypothetical protein